MSYLIFSLAGERPTLRSYRIEEGRVYEESLNYSDDDWRAAPTLRMTQEASGDVQPFDYAVVHELKSPLRAIDAYARALAENCGALLDRESLGMIDDIRGICRETLSLVEDLLEYARVAMRRPFMEAVDIAAMIREAFDILYMADKPRRPVKLIFASEMPRVIADSLLMRQAVSNIVSNSLKFTRNKKFGRIAAGHRRDGGEDVFFISDNGAGFDNRHGDKLFEMFRRLHSADEFEGAGVGLVIAKKIISMHGGRIWITGEVGAGATVCFTLPSDKVLGAGIAD
jgi:light-regulated signal transduction histidine kinase (bacteriophytochrome)